MYNTSDRKALVRKLFKQEYPRAISLLIILSVALSLCMLCTACGPETKTGTVAEFGQSVSAKGGMVQSYVVVKLEDGTELKAWLPSDDAVWTDMRNAAGKGSTRIEIKQDGKFWRYVRAVK